MNVLTRVKQGLVGPIQRRVANMIERATAQLRTEFAATAALLTSNHDTRMANMMASLEALRHQTFALERLVTGTAAARAPGAVAAVARLGTPAVAVVIPTRNRPQFLPEAIASVQAQTFAGWELIIVGDGTDESTAASVEPFLSDPRIRFLWRPHSGGANARNTGISETIAPLIAYLDDDNVWYPDFLARATDALATNPEVDVLYGALVTYAHLLEETCILWRPFDRPTLLQGNFIDTNVIVHRRALVERFGGWDESVILLADWDLMLRYTVEKPALALDVLAARYRVCDDQRVSISGPNASTYERIVTRYR